MNGPFRIGEITPFKYFAGIGLTLVCLFTFVGEDDNLMISFFRWLLQVLIPLVIIISIHLVFDRSHFFNRRPAWLKLIISGVIGAAIFSPIALYFDLLSGLENLAGRSIRHAVLDEFSQVVLPITLAWLAMNAPWLLGYQLKKTDVSDRQIEIENHISSAHDLANFQKLLTDDIRGKIIYLKSELHYLSVHTEKGKALILYNLKDAISELDARIGFQPHRSYWVSKSAIESFKRKGREGILHMIDNAEIPVSRNNISKVKDILSL